MPVLDAVEHLGGLQAQEPLEPYAGLWSRLRDFDPQSLSALLEDRTAVRTLLMRRTLHLVSARDCLRWRPLFEPMLAKRMLATLGRDLPGVDVDELARLGRPHFEAEPRRQGEVARAVGDRWPGVLPRVLGDALSVLVPLVQVPPRGLWGHGAPPARLTTIERWLGSAPAEPASPDEVVLRHLTAFGPAAAADVRAWSGLTGLREAIERLRPRLRSFRDERGRELLDVEDGPLPDPETPAPPRFLPAFDNAVLGFDDRSRIIGADHRRLSVAGARFVLVDGIVSATWTTEPTGDGAPITVVVEPLRPLTAAERDETGAEAERLAAFLGDGAPGAVRIG